MTEMTIKPIETKYDGYYFRSRLEARWAVFFNSLGVRYEYEPEGFVGYSGKAYLPDFFLPDFKVYAEVKGSDEQLEHDWYKIMDAIDFDSTPMSDDGLLILGPIPYKPDWIPYFPMLWNAKGPMAGGAIFMSTNKGTPGLLTPSFDKAGEKALFDGKDWPSSAGGRYHGAADIWLKDACVIDRPGLGYNVTTQPRYVGPYNTNAVKRTNKAYETARSARFER